MIVTNMAAHNVWPVSFELTIKVLLPTLPKGPFWGGELCRKSAVNNTTVKPIVDL